MEKAFRTSSIVKTYRFKEEIRRRTAAVEFATHLAHSIGRRMLRNSSTSIDSLKMSPSEVIPDVESQIHMIIRGEFRSWAETMTEEGEMIHIEHFRAIIGLIEEGLIALLVMMWKMKKIMGVISMKIGGILITNGIVRTTT